MKFHYEFDIKKLQPPITHHQKIMMIGSCFTENIGDKFRSSKFKVLENPNGILFNPISVAESIQQYISNKQFTEDDLFCLNETWHSWKHHSRFSGILAKDALEKINRSTNEANAYLKHADYLFITLGSAWIYVLTEEAAGNNRGTVAANNHKAPANWFSKRLLTVQEIKETLEDSLNKLKQVNPDINIIFTISPVRHLREGVIENNRSKAMLIQAVHDLVNHSSKHYYFPAYELVIDDLRDYRFYAEDLVHPNYHATQYVWEKLVDACLSEETKSLLLIIKEINLAYQHKAFNPSTQLHIDFLHKYAVKTKQLMETNPELDFTKELHYFLNGVI
jgi:hypothetical protein